MTHDKPPPTPPHGSAPKKEKEGGAGPNPEPGKAKTGMADTAQASESPKFVPENRSQKFRSQLPCQKRGLRQVELYQKRGRSPEKNLPKNGQRFPLPDTRKTQTPTPKLCPKEFALRKFPNKENSSSTSQKTRNSTAKQTAPKRTAFPLQTVP